ncbi:hypothetical protein P3W70_07015 [Achromobacter denitrificans]|uniref:hypothetical protein n=1 Tax=Achromobacter denitrificans TaxID=32002 RepID=UPI0023E79FDC|nr:hypothetical protein [Achromobacter denitrificans]MDF3858089.1 hypothetical protein [Achromobacter denitrificans]
MAKKAEPQKKDAPAHEDAAAPVMPPADIPEAPVITAPAEQAPAEPEVTTSDDPPAPEAPAIDALPVFIRKHEDAAARRGAERGEQIVVVEISHPGAGEEHAVFLGRDGGIRLSRGDAGAVYSDGSKHVTP